MSAYVGFVTPILYPILGAVLYYLGARAKITYPIWSHYPNGLYAWAVCPACSGTWYVAFVAVVLGAIQNWPFLWLPGTNPGTWVIAALWGTFWVPVFAHLHLRAMTHVLGEADESDDAAE